jgi:hypothetical protein
MKSARNGDGIDALKKFFPVRLNEAVALNAVCVVTDV